MMVPHVCPWWGGYFLDNRFRRLLHKPEQILADYVQPGMTAMDFGCGMGFFSIPLARMVGDRGIVIAADLQERMLRTLQKRAGRAGVARRIQTHVCQRASIGLDRPVHFALAFWSAHETPNTANLLQEIHDLLVSGGQVLLAEPVGHVTRADFQQLIAAAQSVGLQMAAHPHIRLSHAAVLAKA